MTDTPRVAIRKADTSSLSLTDPAASKPNATWRPGDWPADRIAAIEPQSDDLPPRRPGADTSLTVNHAPSLLRSRR